MRWLVCVVPVRVCGMGAPGRLWEPPASTGAAFLSFFLVLVGKNGI